MADIRIRQLPDGSGPVASDYIPLDNGTTRRATVQQVVEIGRPTASQAEAESGVESSKVMTPLTTKQAVTFYGLTKDGNLAGLTNTTTARVNLGLGSSAVEDASAFQPSNSNLTTLAGVTPGSAGLAILADDLQADVRDYLDTPPYVANRTALKALDTTKDTVAFLSETGRAGVFQWTAGDFSTQIAADTAEGVYIKADAIAATAGAWVRVGEPLLAHFGGSPTSDSASALTVMAAVLGYVVVGPGDFLLTTTTISVPVYFLEGGAITGVAGQTITFRSRIISPKQHIFKGDCTVIFDINDPIGEDSKNSHISWWGVFPRGQDATDQTAAINRALDAYEGEAREGTVEFDNGSYRISGTITIPRGVWIKGAGTRRTIFDLVGAGFTAFQSGGAAVRISGIQFEQPIGSEAYFDGIQIDLQHDTPVVEDVRIWNAKVGVRIGESASAAVLRDVIGNYPNEPGGGYAAGTALVMVYGDRVSIDNVKIVGSTFGPESVINIGQGSTSAVTNTGICNIQTNEKSIPVKIVADTNDIINVNVDGVLYFGDSGNNIPACIDIVSSGTASVQNVLASNVLANSISAALLRINQGSSGQTSTIVLASGAAYTSSTKAADLTRTAGTLSGVIIGGAVNAILNSTPISRSGTMSNIIVPPFMDLTTGTITINDDAVGSFTPPVIGGQIAITDMGSGSAFPNVNHTGAIAFDVGSTPAIAKMSSNGANLIALGTTAPTGTTGTDGNTSVAAVSDGKIYVENRSGGPVTYRWQIL